MLFRQYWRREALGLLGWAATLFLMVLPMVALYPVFMNSDSMKEITRLMEQMPPVLRAYLGGTVNLTTVDGWVQVEIFNALIPLVVLVYTAMAAVGVLTKESDQKTMDFLLALPVRRSSLVLSRFFGLALNLALLHGVILAGTGLGVALIGYTPNWQGYAWVLLNGYLVTLALAALLLTVSVFLDDYPRALMTTIGLALALHFLPIAFEADSTLAWLRKLSFYAYYNAGQVLQTGAIATGDALVLVTAAVGFTALATWLFERKQLSA